MLAVFVTRFTDLLRSTVYRSYGRLFWSWVPLSLEKTILEPSGAQSGSVSSSGLLVRSVWPEPLELMTQMSSVAGEFGWPGAAANFTKAILSALVPGGPHTGRYELPSFVSCVAVALQLFVTGTRNTSDEPSGRRRSKTSWVPSGDHAGLSSTIGSPLASVPGSVTQRSSVPSRTQIC